LVYVRRDLLLGFGDGLLSLRETWIANQEKPPNHDESQMTAIPESLIHFGSPQQKLILASQTTIGLYSNILCNYATPNAELSGGTSVQGRRADHGRRSADRFSDLLAPCESAREALLLCIVAITTQLTDGSANMS
jgi:hypothetical protein